MSSEVDEMDSDPKANKFNDVLPVMSQVKHNRACQQYQKWNKANGWKPITEDHLIKYFEELATRSKPSSLFAIYSMLKSTLRINDSIDIANFGKLLELLKEKNVGYQPIRAKIFADEEIDRFIKEAPDYRWLDVKVVCIFGVSGAFSTKKLVNILVQHIKQYDDMLLVTIPRTETTPQGSFTVTGTFFKIVQKYAELRPKNVSTDRFLLNYHDEKCTAQPIGKNKLNTMPRRMATFLKLTEPERYSTLSFRKNANNSYVNTNAWNAVPSGADEHTTNSVEMDYQTGQQPPASSSSRLKLKPLPSVPVPSVVQQRQTITATVNGYKNGTGSGHVCSLGCGQVQCALEENESSVLHAFTVMKSPEYCITDLTPAVYASEPVCRWIVAYKHERDAVSALNADEAFEEITRSIPNNVRINQKYIRGNSSQLLAAYVVVYGVNCACDKETTTDEFSFAAVNEVLKCEI